jgi:mono/diheme cytochrome c family protein
MKWITVLAIVVLALVAFGCSREAEKAESAAEKAAQEAQAAAQALHKDLETAAGAVFETSCMPCHSGDQPADGLSLEATTFVAATVGIAGSELDTLALVEPGRPDRSYLMMKVMGDERIKGARMPKGAEPLTAEQLKVLNDWIAALPPAQPAN